MIWSVVQAFAAQTSGAGEGPSWQVLGIVVGFLVVVAGVAVTYGVMQAKVTASEKAQEKIEARVKSLEDARVLEAHKAGGQDQRMATLEANAGRTVADIAASEKRLGDAMSSMKQELIGHIDRLAGDIRDVRREDTGTRNIRDLAGGDDTPTPRGRGGKQG